MAQVGLSLAQVDLSQAQVGLSQGQVSFLENPKYKGPTSCRRKWAQNIRLGWVRGHKLSKVLAIGADIETNHTKSVRSVQIWPPKIQVDW